MTTTMVMTMGTTLLLPPQMPMAPTTASTQTIWASQSEAFLGRLWPGGRVRGAPSGLTAKRSKFSLASREAGAGGESQELVPKGLNMVGPYRGVIHGCEGEGRTRGCGAYSEWHGRDVVRDIGGTRGTVQ